ncbi:hypothetical protein [Luteibacter yeojuensis]
MNKLMLAPLVIVVVYLLYVSYFVDDDGGIYRMGATYDAAPVSFSSSCKMEELSVEKRIIYERKKTSVGQVCAERKGSALMVKPTGVFMKRSRFDGSYVVVVRFDKQSSAKIDRVFGQAPQSVVMYRNDTLLTRFLSDGGGFDGEVAAYFDRREDADQAMNQVVSIAGKDAVRSWH